MDIKIKLDFTVNGAVLVPTNEQYAKIKSVVKSIIFNNEEVVEGKRYKGGHKAIRWTDEEYDFIITQFKQGYKFADLTDQLNRKFGKDRTKASVMQRLYKLKTQKNSGIYLPKNILEKFNSLQPTQ